MKATVVHEPKLRRYAVENRWGEDETWHVDRRFKRLEAAKKYADKRANRPDGYTYRVVDSLSVTTSWEEIFNGVQSLFVFVDEQGKEFNVNGNKIADAVNEKNKARWEMPKADPDAYKQK